VLCGIDGSVVGLCAAPVAAYVAALLLPLTADFFALVPPTPLLSDERFAPGRAHDQPPR
jgi:hypothetical protein